MDKFIGRVRELALLQGVLGKPGKHAVMLYGRRRVGKSTLILEALRGASQRVIYYECLQTSLSGNLRELEAKVQELFENKYLHFNDFIELFDYLGQAEEKVIVVLDEYPYLKQLESAGFVDSLMQRIIDTLSDNVDLVLLGSFVGVMKELLERENPLFGRFSLVMNVKPFDYYDSSLFYPEVSIRRKVEFYAVFGGSPFVNAQLDSSKTLEENICRLLLEPDSVVRLYLEHILLSELRKAAGANQVLLALGNGKKHYGEIEQMLGGGTNGKLDKQLKTLLGMEIIEKLYPINKRDDKKKCFYEIGDNLVKFYYCFIYGKADIIMRIGVKNFYHNYISDSLTTFVAHRFEALIREYFIRTAAQRVGLRDVGIFWYDLPAEKRSGEFDVVLSFQDGYEFYEVKYYKNKIGSPEIEQEAEKIRYCVNFVPIRKIGFVVLEGFAFATEKYTLLEGKKLYQVL